MVDLTSRLRVGDIELRYRLTGHGPQRLVCLHGVGSYLEAWDETVALLADHFTVLTYDLRGHGGSARVPGRYEIDDFVRDTLVLADHVGFKRFDLAGFSLGGLIAQRLALTHADRVEGLVLLSTVAGRNETERRAGAERLRALREQGGVQHHEASLSRWLTEAFQEAHPERIAELRRRDAENDRSCYAAAYRVLAETDLGESLDRIAAPTLIVTGQDDLGSTPRMAGFMHERIAGSALHILPGMRHSILVEASRPVAELMAEFLMEHHHG